MGTIGDTPSGYRDRNSTADRALAILELFTESRSVLSANHVSEHLGVARSTAYRYLQSLVQAHYLVEAPGGFSLGLKVLELARIARKGFDVARFAQPVMRELCDELQETILLTRRMHESVVCIEREQPEEQRLFVSYEPGTVMPLNAGASAMCLLAWMPDEQVKELLAIRPLQSFTPNSLTQPGELLERLHEIRDKGYALSIAELDNDVVGVAAPIFDSHGAVRASISVAALISRYTAGQQDVIIRRIVEAGHSISQRLALLD